MFLFQGWIFKGTSTLPSFMCRFFKLSMKTKMWWTRHWCVCGQPRLRLSCVFNVVCHWMPVHPTLVGKAVFNVDCISKVQTTKRVEPLAHFSLLMSLYMYSSASFMEVNFRYQDCPRWKRQHRFSVDCRHEDRALCTTFSKSMRTDLGAKVTFILEQTVWITLNMTE